MFTCVTGLDTQLLTVANFETYSQILNFAVEYLTIGKVKIFVNGGKRSKLHLQRINSRLNSVNNATMQFRIFYLPSAV